jgi:Putative Flp pilus-assembly TadE/G-like
MFATRYLHGLRACCSGGIAVMTGIALPVLFGATAFGIDVSSWYLKQRSMQGGADAAAISAAAAYLAGGDLVAEGKNYASKNGWTDGSNQVTVTITPFLTANPAHIDADIAQQQQPVFSRFLRGGNTAPTVRAHASVTLFTIEGNDKGCLIGLSFTASGGAIQISGQGNLNAPTCTVASNTNTATQAASCLTVNPPCITLGGANAAINIAELDVATRAPFVCPSGTVGTTCKVGTTKTDYPLWTRDPFATRVMPTPPACGTDPATTTSASGVTTYSPGTYCNSISISGAGKNVIFNSGIYFLGGSNNSAAVNLSINSNGGAINQTIVTAAAIATAGTAYKKNDTLAVVGGTSTFAANIKVSTVNGTGGITAVTITNAGAYSATPTNPVSVTGGSGTGAKITLTFTPPPTGVTFILTGPTAATVGTVSIQNATVTLVAPPASGGATNGLIFWQDKKATGTGASFAGNASARTTFNGAMYFPSTSVAVSGNSTFLPTDCTAIVASTISFTGNGSISKGCLSVGGGSGGGATSFRMSQ